jgi:hypothetical protein
VHVRVATPGRFLLAGVEWLVLTLMFEFGVGRLVLYLPWERLLVDYDIVHGSLLPVGLLAMTLSPLVAAKLRGVM